MAGQRYSKQRNAGKTKAAERRTDPFLLSAAPGDPRESPISVLTTNRAPLATLGLLSGGVKDKFSDKLSDEYGLGL
jgi:hypothetical protein